MLAAAWCPVIVLLVLRLFEGGPRAHETPALRAFRASYRARANR